MLIIIYKAKYSTKLGYEKKVPRLRSEMSSVWDKPVQVTFRGVSLARESEEVNERPVISPRSKAYRFWDVLNTLAIFLTCLVVPFQACFSSNVVAFWVLSYVFDALFLIDVLLRFHVGYFRKGSLITEKKLVRKRYVRGAFGPDVLTLVPLDFLVFAVSTSSRWHQTLSLLRLNRVLRVYRLFSFFGEFFSVTQYAFVLELVKL